MKSKKKPRGKPFPKGVSGNPAGRPANPFRDLIKDRTRNGEEIVEGVMDCFRQPENQKIKLWAAEWLRDTGWGKPVSYTELDGSNGLPIGVIFLPNKDG